MNHDHADWPFWISLGGYTSGECVGSSWLLIILVVLCGGVVVGYSIIAHNWHRLEKLSTNRQGADALHSLRNIFILCAICGYGLVIVRAVVPAWSLTIMALVCLNVVTWRYISQLKALTDIHRDAALLDQIKQELLGKTETPLETAIRCKSLLDKHLQRMNSGPHGNHQDSRSI